MTQRSNDRTGNQALVREINLAAVMEHLSQQAPASRAALAEISGLNKTTVSSLIQELISYRLVREIGRRSTGAGRPAVLLDFDPTAGAIVSCEIGVDFIYAICTNFATKVIWQNKQAIQPGLDQDAIINQTIEILRQGVAIGMARHQRILGLALSVPGLVDQGSGTLLFAPNLNWENLPIRQRLEAEFQLPIFFNNEANMAALGEYYFGAAKNVAQMIYISAGVGLGGGIVRDGHVVQGSTGFAGEFGHMTMDPDGLWCNCGNQGCWETLVSQAALFRLIKQRILTEGHHSKLADIVRHNPDQLTVSIVIDAAEDDDPVALAALSQIGHSLGIGIASLINALNPDLVIFGGILSLAGPFLLPIVNNEVQRRTLRWNARATQVIPAHYGFEAAVMGGVATIYQAILSQPTTMVQQFYSDHSV